MIGQKVYHSTISNQKNSTEIDVSYLPKGIYFIKINESVNTEVIKIVIQ
jgi:hypothetical protein